MRPRLAWGLLLTLLAALLVGALTFDRRTWGAFVGDEATYLMAAQSLIWDGDLEYGARDYQRFVATWGSPPEGLILQRGTSGSSLTYAKEAIYPLILAPLTRLAPTQAAPITNALALALASVLAAHALRRSLGPAAPLWVAVLVFGSVTFAHVYWAHADLMLLCMVVIACALLRLGQENVAEPGGAVIAWRCAVAGALLATVVAARLPYLPLLLAAALMLPPRHRRLGGLALALGALVPIALGAWLNLSARGVLSSYQGERRAFYSYTGFPSEGAATDAWENHAQEHGSGSWIETPAPQLPFITAQQLGWNSLYFLCGRTVGVLPYFLPLLALFTAFRPRGGRLAVVLAALAIALLFLLLRPFNFWGGGGALANRYFLPVTGALWFVAARPLRARWAVLTALCAAPFLWPLWLEPRAFPLTPEGTLRHVAPLARWLLPYETTQSHLKPAGREDVVHGGLWVKFLSPTIHSEAGDATLVLEGGEGELLLGSASPLAAVSIEVLDPPGARLRLAGSAQGEVAAGTQRWLPLHLRARHPMWWTTAPFHLYELGLERSSTSPSGPLRFQLRPPA